MGLSDNERRVLDELEASFYDRDPKLARSLARGESRPRRLAAALGVLSALVGMVLLILAVSASMPLVGVLGFLVALAGLSFWASRNYPSPRSRSEGLL